ncbi:MAG: LD-carboxypeptidase [Pseudomonadota bacterium]|nr:LD-carboxypeptidase [Pseudomonadota bacterium]
MEKVGKKWESLGPGDQLDIVAPGFRTEKKNLQAAVQRIKSWPIYTNVPKNIFGPDVICSNSDKIRLKHLKAALISKSKIIWSVRAGYGFIRLLDGLQKIPPPKKTKLIVGYSDVTSFFGFVIRKWNWPVLHAPLFEGWGLKKTTPRDDKLLEEIFFGKIKEVVYGGLIPMNTAAKRKKKIHSKVLGGNLTVFVSTLKLPWQVNTAGAILFFEDIGERGYRIDRCLKLLEQHGVLKKVKAIIFGAFIEGSEPDGSDKVWPVIGRFAKAQKFPVFCGLKAGHGKDKLPIPLNTKATLTCGAPGKNSQKSMGKIKIDTGIQK